MRVSGSPVHITFACSHNSHSSHPMQSASVAKLGKLGGKVSLTTGKSIYPPKIETTSTRWHYCFQITNHVTIACLLMASMQKQRRIILPSFILEC